MSCRSSKLFEIVLWEVVVPVQYTLEQLFMKQVEFFVIGKSNNCKFLKSLIYLQHQRTSRACMILKSLGESSAKPALKKTCLYSDKSCNSNKDWGKLWKGSWNWNVKSSSIKNAVFLKFHHTERRFHLKKIVLLYGKVKRFNIKFYLRNFLMSTTTFFSSVPLDPIIKTTCNERSSFT